MLPRHWSFEVRVHRRRVAAGLIVVAALVSVGGWLAWTLWGSSDGSTRAALEREFAGSYPVSPAVSVGVVDVVLTAAPSTASISDAGATAVWAYNGTVPGPELRVDLGDLLRVELRNELPVPTTIHWHGVRVPNGMDGVPGVNQEPVAPGETFTYEFMPPDAGTFWYHSHTDGSEQLERGLYGSLVVDDAVSAAYSQDVAWVVDDWLLGADAQVDPDFANPSDVEHNGRWGQVVTVNGSTSEVLRARPGERLRIRMINASNGRVYAPDFGELQALVIGIDGLYVRDPQPLARHELAPGARIDVDVVVPTTGTFEVIDDFTGDVFGLATIVAEGGPVATPDFLPPTAPNVPRWAGASDVSVDAEYRLAIRRGDSAWEWTMNGRSYPDAAVLDVERGRFTRIRLRNDSQQLHPMHLHGQFFKVTARNGQPVDEGHFRDTVLVYPGEQVDIGLVATDEGQWVLHCHIQEHAEAGMMTLVNVRR